MRAAVCAAMAIGGALFVAPALAEDNPACAKYQEPLAYNACLARLGPPAHGARAMASPPGDAAVIPGEPRVRGLVVTHGKRGRVRMEFDVIPGAKRS